MRSLCRRAKIDHVKGRGAKLGAIAKEARQDGLRQLLGLVPMQRRAARRRAAGAQQLLQGIVLRMHCMQGMTDTLLMHGCSPLQRSQAAVRMLACSMDACTQADAEARLESSVQRHADYASTLHDTCTSGSPRSIDLYSACHVHCCAVAAHQRRHLRKAH